jgi:hypothetical protein
VARPASPRIDDDDRLRLAPASPPRRRKRGKKNPPRPASADAARRSKSRHGRADFLHPALGQDLTPSSTARRAQAGSDVRTRSARNRRPGALSALEMPARRVIVRAPE